MRERARWARLIPSCAGSSAPPGFEAAARYGEAYPSRSGDLHAYGGDFARFLERYPHALGLPYLPDVARLEWAVHESQQAADGGACDYAALGGVPAEGLASIRIRLRPCVRLVGSAHPVLSIWEANQPLRDGTPTRMQGADLVAVRRIGADVVPVAVGAGEWILLQAFGCGASLGDAAGQLERSGEGLEPVLLRLARMDVLGGFSQGAR